ncbi:hypothetical protein EXU57_07410 [Segetibacter sp. 3557_3]|uniref:hypothetical protein n=1 Tax=Segetibacter sp. 3557_3 TaxID=2547429 RepID=UPI0010584DFC|nr:hypothetical protein [Segetibacter sp. 3557_3]TDH27404.1 hypothetical protein EXU57_07410 [Segetibacter sp. 3557_3]
MKYLALCLMLFAIACNTETTENDKKTDSKIITNDTVPEVRTNISKAPVASYMVPLGNPVQKWFFGVQVFETNQTFKYLLRMQYEGMIETDTLRLPNFGTWPVVEVRKGSEKLSCIIGFLDQQKQFKEYKKLVVEVNNMKLVVLKRYSVGVTQTKKE